MTSARGIAAAAAAIFACLLPVAGAAAHRAHGGLRGHGARREWHCGSAARARAHLHARGGSRLGHRLGHRHRRHHLHRHSHRRGASAGACATGLSAGPRLRRARGSARGVFSPVPLPARLASTADVLSDGGDAGETEGTGETAGSGGAEGGGSTAEPPAEEEPPRAPSEEAPAPSEESAPPGEESAPPSEEAPAPSEESAPPSEEIAPPSEESGGSGGGSTEPFRFFSPTSFWNEALPSDAQIDPNSAAIVGALAGMVATEEEIKKGPAINTTAWSVPVYTVPADQPLVYVKLPYASMNPALQSAWEAVPLPANALPAVGTDKHLVVWQPSSKHLWEFWHLEDKAEGWEAYWGGAIQDVSSASGAYGPEAWPGAKTGWGASASSLSIAGGLITLEDLEKGAIDHALAIAVPNTRAKVFAAPAQRTDGGSSAASSLPEGAHLRLNPNLDLAALHLPPFTLMLAEAAQRYGIVVRDTAANVALYAQDPTPTGVNPYTGKTGYFEGKGPAALLAVFPWSELELLKMELRP